MKRAVGPVPLAWLDRTCTAARAAVQKVIIFADHPVWPVGIDTLVYVDEVIATIERHPQTVAWLNGQNPAGNFAYRNGVPFAILHGMVETAYTSTFAIGQFFSYRMTFSGRDRGPSRELVFRPT